MTFKFASIAALALMDVLISPVAAQSIVQERSQIALPASFDGMAVERSEGKWSEFASAFIYEGSGDRIEILVYQPSYPSVGLWYHQGERRTLDLFSQVKITPAGQPELFSVGSKDVNAIRRFYEVGSPFASTAVAVAGFGEWIVSVRSSSKTLNVDEQRARLEAIMGQIGVPPSLTESRYPAVEINDCTGSKELALGAEGEPPLTDVTLEMKTSGGLAAMVASQDAFAGERGIAAQPTTYCRRESISGRTVWFETVNTQDMQRWVLPISETGITVEGILVPTINANNMPAMLGVVLTNDHLRTGVRNFYSELPNPVSAQLDALVDLAADVEPYASVDYGTAEIKIIDRQ